MQFERRTAVSKNPSWGLVVVLVLLVVGVLYASGRLNLTGLSTTGGGGGGTGGGGLQATTLPLKIVVTDPLGAAAVTSATVVVYTTSGGFYTSPAVTGSDGSTTTGPSFTTGACYLFKVSASTYVTEWLPACIPAIPGNGAAITSIPMNLYDIKLGTWTWTLTGTGGTTFSTATTYHFATGVGTGATLTIAASLSETVANSGYLSCNPNTGLQYDILNKVCQYGLIQIKDTGVALSVTGMPRSFVQTSTRLWWAILTDGVGVQSPSNGGMGTTGAVGSPGAGPEAAVSDSIASGALTQQTIGASVYGGTSSIQFQVNQGSLTGSSTETLTFNFYYYSDPGYYPTNNNLGPNAATANTNSPAAFTIVFMAG